MSIPVLRAETFYLPPPQLPADAWDLVAPAERVFRWYEYRVQRRVTPPDGFIIGQRVWARINHNRWVADCPCGSAQVVTPADPRTACTECGLGWLIVVFPEAVAAIEASLADRLPDQRNWWHPDDTTAWDRPPEPEPPVEPLTTPEALG